MFRSFFLAGFECASGVNRHGERLDQICATEHDRFLQEDYARTINTGIRTVREGVQWNLVDRRGRLDLTTLQHVVNAASREGIEVIYDLFHYGYPEDLHPLEPHFTERFAYYCYAVANYVMRNSDGPWFFTPVNEPSYFAWAGGEMGLFAPHLTGEGDALKRALVKAAIEGTNAIWSASREAQIITVDPICHVVPATEEEQSAADNFNSRVVYQSLDMLSGRTAPELGGSPAHLGTIGINYYWKNQWVLGGDTLADDDPRRIPLRDIVRDVYRRYGRKVLLSETAHVGDKRGAWLTYCAEEMLALMKEGVPVQGICLYPILGMPEWHQLEEWVRMGLWDLHPNESGSLDRHLHIPLFDALTEARIKIERYLTHRAESAAVQMDAMVASQV